MPGALQRDTTSAEAAPWIPLRPLLKLHRGPSQRSGAPSWTLEDPLRCSFFRLGWIEHEIIARWTLGSTDAIVAAVNEATTLAITVQDVERVRSFLDMNGLLATPQPTQRLLKEHQGRQRSWAQWLLRHYLFLRIPLIRADRLLTRALPWVTPLFTRSFLILTVSAALFGLLLILRQWDSFAHSFLYFFSPEGIVLAALTIALSKVVHELGHAFTCKRFGCPVPTIGLAFLVLYPVLYTDTSAAWTLPHRRQRLAIGAAGMIAEVALSCYALALWTFLPDGPLRSAVFTLATTSWVVTLAVNLNPLMRFDGYFLLSDALDVPNLQPRAFAMLKWALRRTLFDASLPPPDPFPPALQRILILYGIAVCIYRLLLFIGIALIVYTLFFKLLGIVLFVVELSVFVARPILTELKAWHCLGLLKRRTRRRTISALGVVILLALAILPWQSGIHAPALWRARDQLELFAPMAGTLTTLPTKQGQPVAAGSMLVALQVPSLNHEIATVNRQIALLRWQSAFQTFNRKTTANTDLARREWHAAVDRHNTLMHQRAQLTIKAPFSGQVSERAPALSVGDTVKQGEWLGTLTGTSGTMIEAYVGESDLGRLAIGDHAAFFPEDGTQTAIPATVTEIASTAITSLSSAPELASVYDGPIAATKEENQPPIAQNALYRVLLSPDDQTLTADRVTSGAVVIDGEGRSPVIAGFSRIAAVLIRELSF